MQWAGGGGCWGILVRWEGNLGNVWELAGETKEIKGRLVMMRTWLSQVWSPINMGVGRWGPQGGRTEIGAPNASYLQSLNTNTMPSISRGNMVILLRQSKHLNELPGSGLHVPFTCCPPLLLYGAFYQPPGPHPSLVVSPLLLTSLIHSLLFSSFPKL